MDSNPFTAMEQAGHRAYALATAFAVSQNAEQLFACLRYEKRNGVQCRDLVPYLDGSFFQEFLMPCGNSKLYSNDVDGEAQNTFVHLQELANKYLGLVYI